MKPLRPLAECMAPYWAVPSLEVEAGKGPVLWTQETCTGQESGGTQECTDSAEEMGTSQKAS
jgi:hypothetical protein